MALRGASAHSSEDEIEESSDSVHTPEPHTFPEGNQTGASISPEMVEEVVKIAQDKEPHIAEQAQEALDTLQAENEQAELEAKMANEIQEERKPADQKKHEASLKEAKTKFRKDESPEQHNKRLSGEWRLEKEGAQEAKNNAPKLATEAAEYIKPKLEAIETKAAGDLAEVQKQNEEAAEIAELHKKQNEEHVAKVAKELKQKQAKLEEEAKHDLHPPMFTFDSTKLSTKIKGLQDKLSETKADDKPEVDLDTLVAPQIKVTNLVTAFENKVAQQAKEAEAAKVIPKGTRQRFTTRKHAGL